MEVLQIIMDVNGSNADGNGNVNESNAYCNGDVNGSNAACNGVRM